MKLYIDPGTGAMLFAMLTGLIGLAGYFLKGLRVKLRFLISGGKKAEESSQVIPFVIFSDDKRYWPVFEPICRELDQKGFDVTYMTASPDDQALENGYEHVHAEFIGEGNKAFMRLNFLKATVVLSTTPGLDVYQWKRSKDVKYYIHIPHMPGELTTYRMFGLDYYDALLLSGQYQIDDCRALEKLRNLPEKECTIVGIPYLDEKAKRLEGTASEPHERTVLVAPSWGNNSLLNRFGNTLIDRLIVTGYRIVIRPHPQSFISEKELIDRLMKDYPQLEWNRDTDNFDVLNRSDIMISDFSGVIFDYSLVFDKPVICAYTDFDDSQYDAWWLDTPIWTATAIPRIGPVLREENLPKIKEMIDSAIENSSNEVSRHEVRDETWANCGLGAQLAAEYLIYKYRKLITEPEVTSNLSAEENVVVFKEQTEKEEIVAVDFGEESHESNTAEAAMESESIETVTIAAKDSELDETAKDFRDDQQKTKRPKRNRFIIVVASIAAVLIIAVLGLRYALIQNTERQYEWADLELMRAALSASKLKIEQGSIDEKEEYWYSWKLFQLIPADYDRPKGYGLGTTRVGGASDSFFKKYTESGTHFFKYDEDQDYTDKIIKVTIDPEEKMITLRWVEGGNASETTSNEESTG